jgi:hypothetical protein
MPQTPPTIHQESRPSVHPTTVPLPVILQLMITLLSITLLPVASQLSDSGQLLPVLPTLPKHVIGLPGHTVRKPEYYLDK